MRGIVCTVAQNSPRIEFGSPDTHVLNNNSLASALSLLSPSVSSPCLVPLHHLLQEQPVFGNLLPLVSAGGLTKTEGVPTLWGCLGGLHTAEVTIPASLKSGAHEFRLAWKEFIFSSLFSSVVTQTN